MSLVEKLFGSFSDRELKKVNPITKQVLALEPKYQAMSDADLQAQTAAFKQQLAEGKTLDARKRQTKQSYFLFVNIFCIFYQLQIHFYVPLSSCSFLFCLLSFCDMLFPSISYSYPGLVDSNSLSKKIFDPSQY